MRPKPGAFFLPEENVSLLEEGPKVPVPLLERVR
jgi:hypothetical protein